MENTHVLIVCDTPDRTHYLSHHIRLHGMKPIRYPNHLSALHALKVDAFGMVVVDLTLPVDTKIELIKAGCMCQKSARILAIGKTLYLEEAEVLNDVPSVEQISNIQDFPDYLAKQEFSKTVNPF